MGLGQGTQRARGPGPRLARGDERAEGHCSAPLFSPVGRQQLASGSPRAALTQQREDLGKMWHSVGGRGEGVVTGLWGRFLPYWEMSAEVEARGQERPGDGLGGRWWLRNARGVFRLRCPAWVVSAPVRDPCRPATAIRGPALTETLSLVIVLLGKTGSTPPRFAGLLQMEETIPGGKASFLALGKSSGGGKRRQ